LRIAYIAAVNPAGPPPIIIRSFIGLSSLINMLI
jgi:hypothetical protein